MSLVWADNDETVASLVGMADVSQQSAIAVSTTGEGSRRLVSSFFQNPPPGRHVVLSFSHMAAYSFQPATCLDGRPRFHAEPVQNFGALLQVFGGRRQNSGTFPLDGGGFAHGPDIFPAVVCECPAVVRGFLSGCQAFPKNCSAFHQDFRACLKVIPAFLETLGGFPKVFRACPDSFRVFSEPIRGFVKSFGAFPEWFRAFPESFSVFAELLGDFPESFRVFVKSFRVFPESFRENPESSGNTVFSSKTLKNAKNASFYFP
jgi:hypothetical protein